jgi:hypothetical protein
VEELSPGEAHRIGRRVRLLTKGWLPSKLRWESRATEADPPRRLAIAATGDFEGRGIWSLEQNG